MKTKMMAATLMAVLLVGGIATVNATNNLYGKEQMVERAKEKMEITEEDVESVKQMIPETYEEAEQLMEDESATTSKGLWGEEEVVPTIKRFILWTHDGIHVMWGQYGNGYFVGEDNEGEEVWGIYHGGTFAGFYGEEFFHGMYRGNRWIAHDLFGEDYSFGRFELFPRNYRRPRIQPVPVYGGSHGVGKPEIIEAVAGIQ